ncbi:hypothetical protein HDA45_004245 [Amycolatopsis umgeniensis]|uniref:Uncharacterized protein n=1 Tax=Amycolatopsis umgeniensis TaxID=336628 RepID=A0A841B6L4_9PSEU|nr:hypothetical protein [Amycolatopsis umgeniensis]
MQRLVALERNYDVTIGVPTVLGEVFLDRLRQHRRDPTFVSGHALVISLPQRHDVVVGSELSTTGQLTNVLLALALKRHRHFLRDDVATEHAREGIAHEVLEPPIKAFDAAHRATSSHVCFPVDPIRVRPVGHGPR